MGRAKLQRIQSTLDQGRIWTGSPGEVQGTIHGQEGSLWNHHQNNRGDISLQMNKHHNYLSGTLSLPRATQRSGKWNQRNYLAFLPWAAPLPTALCQKQPGLPAPFKNIINILSRVGCAHYLQMDASCLVSSHSGFGIICQAMLLVPFSLIKGTFWLCCMHLTHPYSISTSLHWVLSMWQTACPPEKNQISPAFKISHALRNSDPSLTTR